MGIQRLNAALGSSQAITCPAASWPEPVTQEAVDLLCRCLDSHAQLDTSAHAECRAFTLCTFMQVAT